MFAGGISCQPIWCAQLTARACVCIYGMNVNVFSSLAKACLSRFTALKETDKRLGANYRRFCFTHMETESELGQTHVQTDTHLIRILICICMCSYVCVMWLLTVGTSFGQILKLVQLHLNTLISPQAAQTRSVPATHTHICIHRFACNIILHVTYNIC